jgi:hypothetical protein
MALKLSVLSLIIAVLAACGLYALKHEVQRLDARIGHTRAAIAEERMALTRLRAEWATLNQPGRLGRLASAHLELTPARPRQIVRIADIPLRQDVGLSQRGFQVVVGNGIQVPLRFKPSATMDLVQEPARPELRRAALGGGQ